MTAELARHGGGAARAMARHRVERGGLVDEILERHAASVGAARRCSDRSHRELHLDLARLSLIAFVPHVCERATREDAGPGQRDEPVATEDALRLAADLEQVVDRHGGNLAGSFDLFPRAIACKKRWSAPVAQLDRALA